MPAGGARLRAARRPLHARSRARRRPPAAPAHGVERRRLPACRQADERVEVVDVELAGHVGAAEAELARRAQQVGDRARRADGEARPVAVAVDGSVDPSQNSTVNGRSGRACSISLRSGPVVVNAIGSSLASGCALLGDEGVNPDDRGYRPRQCQEDISPPTSTTISPDRPPGSSWARAYPARTARGGSSARSWRRWSPDRRGPRGARAGIIPRRRRRRGQGSRSSSPGVGGRTRRLKLNGQLTGYSPLSRVVELEGLAARGRGARRRALADAARRSGIPRLSRATTSTALIARAERQRDGLERAPASRPVCSRSCRARS